MPSQLLLCVDKKGRKEEVKQCKTKKYGIVWENDVLLHC